MTGVASIAIIGFGEAAAAFAPAWRAAARATAFDVKTLDPATAAGKHADYAAAGVIGLDTLAAALAGAEVVVSLVTADAALDAARAAAKSLAPGALFLDMNSVAPATKRGAAAAVEDAGGRYVDVAVLAPVHPGGLLVPLLVCGDHAGAAVAALAALGFAPAVADGPTGSAAAIKMIRSVMVKGIEALSAECFLAAHAAGVADAVAASLDAARVPPTWTARADYNLDRMLVHGLRRAAELDEVAATLDALGTGSAMTRAAAGWQRAIGGLAAAVPRGLAAKTDLILDDQQGQRAA